MSSFLRIYIYLLVLCQNLTLIGHLSIVMTFKSSYDLLKKKCQKVRLLEFEFLKLKMLISHDMLNQFLR